MPHKYYLPEQIRSPWQRFIQERFQRRRPTPDFPLHAQLQTITGCNASCVFCPHNKTARKIPAGRKMDMGLFKKIVDELLDRPVMRISPYLMNEPLLDSDLPQRIAYIAQRKKRGQFTKINSNGGLLSEKMAQALLDSGLDRLNFSVHGIEREAYESVMVGLKLERVLANIDRFLELKREGGYRLPRVRIAMLVTQTLQPQLPEIREYWGARNIKINLNQLENRGAHQAIQADEIAAHPLENYAWCKRMFEQVYILHDGRLVLCCADWEQCAVMGDASRQSLAEIWNGPRYAEFRRRFQDGEVKGMLCDGCTKDAVGGDDEDE